MPKYEVELARVVTDELRGMITVEAENADAAWDQVMALIDKGEILERVAFTFFTQLNDEPVEIENVEEIKEAEA